jgi:hypothetical protein
MIPSPIGKWLVGSSMYSPYHKAKLEIPCNDIINVAPDDISQHERTTMKYHVVNILLTSFPKTSAQALTASSSTPDLRGGSMPQQCCSPLQVDKRKDIQP